MQKVINTIALLSGLVSLSVLASAGYLYVNKDALLEDARRRATEAVTKAIADTLPKMIDSAMPEIPEPPKFPTETGGVIPQYNVK
jgi:uncharacterized membrane protein (Fun14 family)